MLSCGLKTVGQIHPTNDLLFRKDQNALGVAVELLTTHTPGAPVVNEQGEFIGFISEFDVLRALEAQRDLSRLKAEDISAGMVRLMERQEQGWAYIKP